MTTEQLIILFVGYTLGYGFFVLVNALMEAACFFHKKNKEHKEKRKAGKDSKK